MGNTNRSETFGVSQAELDTIHAAIAAAEKETSGEIRVHIDARCAEDVMDRAATIFEELEMHKTEARNGVLIYLATKSRKFAILGDAGINAQVPDGFWDDAYAHALSLLKQEKWGEALSGAVHEAGQAMKTFFPYAKGDTNELSDEVSFGK